MHHNLILIAQGKPLEDNGILEGIGPMGMLEGYSSTNPCPHINQFVEVMSKVIGLLTVIAGLYFVFILITGAISWLSSGGEKMGTENAQKRITSGLVGLVIVIAGVFIIQLIGKLLGLDILNPGNSLGINCSGQ